MSSHAPEAQGLLFSAALAAANTLAWISNFNAGAVATSITVVAVALIAVYGMLANKKTETEANRVREEAKAQAEAFAITEEAKAKAWAERTRLEMQIASDREKFEANSLTAQNQKLTTLIEEGNARLKDAIDRDTERTEAANKKLHAMANERQVEVLRHHEESQRLTRQLELTTKQLEETNEELHAARAEIRAMLAKNEQTQRQVSANSQDIKTLAENQLKAS